VVIQTQSPVAGRDGKFRNGGSRRLVVDFGTWQQIKQRELIGIGKLLAKVLLE
jgi:hypothetical protein